MAQNSIWSHLVIGFQWSHFFSEMDSEIDFRIHDPMIDRFNGATSFQKWIDRHR